MKVFASLAPNATHHELTDLAEGGKPHAARMAQFWDCGRVTGKPEAILLAWFGGWIQWVDATLAILSATSTIFSRERYARLRCLEKKFVLANPVW